MRSKKYLCLVLGLLLFPGCNCQHEGSNKIKDEREVVCRLIGERIFDIHQTGEEAESHIVKSYRIISEQITIYDDRFCEWSFRYIDEERSYVFKDRLPDNIFACLVDSLKNKKQFKLKDGTFEIKYDFANSSVTSLKGVADVLEFLTKKYET